MRFKSQKAIVVFNSVLVRSFFSLAVFQLMNIALPFLMYPYLLSKLDTETFGFVTFAQAIANYLLIFVSFGFNISATKLVSVYRESRKELNEVYSSVLIIKSMLFFLAICILQLMNIFFPQNTSGKFLFILSTWICVYDIVFPIWLFQGLEKMKYITYISFFSRIGIVPLTFFLINSNNDFLLVPGLNWSAVLIAGVMSAYIIKTKLGLTLLVPSKEKVYLIFSDSILLFFSNLSSRIYVGANKVILGYFTNYSSVLYYDLAEKCTAILKVPQSLLAQTIFPKISRDKDKVFIRKVLLFTFVFHVILVFLTFYLSEWLVLIIGGRDMLYSLDIFRVLMMSVPVIALSNVYGIQTLIPFGKIKAFTKITVFAFVVYLGCLVCLYLFCSISPLSVSFAVVITELIVLTLMYLTGKKYNLHN